MYHYKHIENVILQYFLKNDALYKQQATFVSLYIYTPAIMQDTIWQSSLLQTRTVKNKVCTGITYLKSLKCTLVGATFMDSV
jgi:ABC-type long-subunit fatty acid transport system fused permease/ATPase subunit